MIPGLHLTLGGRPPTTIVPYCGQLALSGSVVTVGSFDGVRRGHQGLLNHVVSRARTAGVARVVYTVTRLRNLLSQGRYGEAAELHGWDDNWPRTGDGSSGSHDIDW